MLTSELLALADKPFVITSTSEVQNGYVNKEGGETVYPELTYGNIVYLWHGIGKIAT